MRAARRRTAGDTAETGWRCRQKKVNKGAMKLKTVGIKNIRYPVKIREKSGGLQDTVASITLQASMPRAYRETCVSAFLAVLNKYQEEINVSVFSRLLQEVKDLLQADSAHLEMTFPYFLEKKAPVTKTSGLMEYTCRFTGGIGAGEDFILSIWVPSTTLCPCSKEISRYGAHNQRAEINLNIKPTGFVWMEDLISMVESGVSCEVYSILKRPDEKFVTEQAYNNPMFVEDVVRRVAELAQAHPCISWFSVGVESFESIHKHSAYAFVDSDDLVGEESRRR
jgi:GTP cyclohydrolase I